MHGGSAATIDPFLYTFTITAHPRTPIEKALSALDDEIARIQDAPPSEEEVARAIGQARHLCLRAENITNQAFWLGYAEMFADYDWFTTYLTTLAQVTPAEVQRAAQTCLRRKNRVVGLSLPASNEGEA